LTKNSFSNPKWTNISPSLSHLRLKTSLKKAQITILSLKSIKIATNWF
jgi:hypothetical protein